MEELSLKEVLDAATQLQRFEEVNELAKQVAALWFEEPSIMRRAKFALVMDELYKATHEAR